MLTKGRVMVSNLYLALSLHIRSKPISLYEMTYQQILMSVILGLINVSKTVTIPTDPTHALAVLGTDLELMDSYALVQILSV